MHFSLSLPSGEVDLESAVDVGFTKPAAPSLAATCFRANLFFAGSGLTWTLLFWPIFLRFFFRSWTFFFRDLLSDLVKFCFVLIWILNFFFFFQVSHTVPRSYDPTNMVRQIWFLCVVLTAFCQTAVYINLVKLNLTNLISWPF